MVKFRHLKMVNCGIGLEIIKFRLGMSIRYWYFFFKTWLGCMHLCQPCPFSLSPIIRKVTGCFLVQKYQDGSLNFFHRI